MLKIATVMLCAGYFVCVLAVVPWAGPRMAPWVLSALSVALVWSYLVLARGRATAPLAVVIVVTLVFPIGALVMIAWPLYASRTDMITSLWTAFAERGPVGCTELLAPTATAALCAALVRRWRRSTAVNPDAAAPRV
jgi:hypothetical protein